MGGAIQQVGVATRQMGGATGQDPRLRKALGNLTGNVQRKPGGSQSPGLTLTSDLRTWLSWSWARSEELVALSGSTGFSLVTSQTSQVQAFPSCLVSKLS